MNGATAHALYDLSNLSKGHFMGITYFRQILHERDRTHFRSAIKKDPIALETLNPPKTVSNAANR